jgi:hypothetical protein
MVSVYYPMLSRAALARWLAVRREGPYCALKLGPSMNFARFSPAFHLIVCPVRAPGARRYTPIHVQPDAPRGASRRAAVVQAAYTALVGLFPAQAAAFEADLETSLAGIAADKANENSQSIARGRDWGEQVALEILAWRAGDDLAQTVPPTTGNTDPGQWRPTLPAFAPMSAPNMGSIEPFVIESALDFRPGPPLSLTSSEYADEVNAVQAIGAANSTTRTDYQTGSARFWASTATLFWNKAAASASRDRNLTLSDNARLFAVLNLAGADAVIVCWDSKLHYNFWRPITAIRLADTDDNPGTTAATEWLPLINTPPYPDYFSGRQSGSGAAAYILTAFFGAQPVSGVSEGLTPIRPTCSTCRIPGCASLSSLPSRSSPSQRMPRPPSESSRSAARRLPPARDSTSAWRPPAAPVAMRLAG